ncbi:MAG: HD family hydrolase [Lachnospiraceae bacterium]
MNRLEQQMNFLLELDKLKQIKRQTLLIDGTRQENDVEHSWHLTLFAMVLSEYANEQVDLLKTMKMVMLHDVIELDAGDTYAYDETGNATKKEREEKAADRIFHLLPEDQAAEYRALWDEFEAMDTPESKFANTLDKIQPVLLNHLEGGTNWRKHHVKERQILDRNKRTPEGSQSLWDYVRPIIEENIAKGNIISDGHDEGTTK